MSADMSVCNGELVWRNPADPYDPSVACTKCDGHFVSSLPLYCFAGPDFVPPPKRPVAQRTHDLVAA